MRRWLTLGLTTSAIVLSMLSSAQGAGSAPSSAEIAALSQEMPRANIASDSFYFVMTDRYANGDTSNDQGAGGIAAGLASGGFNAADAGYFHGGDFVGLNENLDRVKKMGFTAVWITPPFVQRAVQGGSAGYHGYWILDFTTIDPHLGTEADFAGFVDHAKQLGLKIYLDIVVNHTADVITYRDGTGFSSVPKNAYIPSGLEGAKSPAFLNDLANYHLQGNVGNWDDVSQYQNGDFAGLDDVKTENDVVVDGFAKTYADWIVKYGIDGFRIDTAKHVDDAFFQRWQTKLIADVRAVNPDFAMMKNFNMFGEIYDDNAAHVAPYMLYRGLPSALDFPMQKQIVDFASGYGQGKALTDALLWDDFYNTGSAANAYALTVFGGNHDMGRLANLLGAGKSSTKQVQLATSLLFLMRGAPVVYYGDEVGMIGEGGDKAARQDMFPTQVKAWQVEERVGSDPIGKGTSLSSASLTHPVAKYIAALNALRVKYPALAAGALVIRGAKAKVAMWSKLDAADRREFVVVSNAGATTVNATIPTSTPKSSFAGVFGVTKSAKSDAKGQLTIAVPGQTTVVLRAANRLPALAAPSLSVFVESAPAIHAGMAVAKGGKDPLTVTFIARTCSTCEWIRLGSDDAAPFRLPIIKAMFAGAQAMDLAAISRTPDGKLAVGAVTRVATSQLPF